MSEEGSFKWFASTQRVHFGAVLDSRTGRKGLDIPPLLQKGNAYIGTAFKSNGLDELVWEGSHYKIPAIAGMVSRGWIRLATSQEVTAVETGKVSLSAAAVSTATNVPDSDQILKDRLKQAGMEEPKADHHSVISLEQINAQKPETQKSKLGVPADWDFSTHWMNRKRALEKVTSENELLHLKKRYANTDFEKHIDARLEKLGQQIQRGAVRSEVTPQIEAAPPKAPIQGMVISGIEGLAKLEDIQEPPSEATASLEGLEPGVGPLRKPAPIQGGPKIDSRPVNFDKK